MVVEWFELGLPDSDWCVSQGMRVAGSNRISIGGSFPYSLLSTSQSLELFFGVC